MPSIDVLIVTAVPDEYAAVLQVETGAKPGSAWEERAGFTIDRSAGWLTTPAEVRHVLAVRPEALTAHARIFAEGA